MRFLMFNDSHLAGFGSNWRRFLFFGIALVVLGCLAVSAATFTTMLSVRLFGILILLSGIVIALDSVTFWRGKWGGFLLHLLVAVLYLYVGVFLIKDPEAASVSLTLLLGIFYIIAGAFRILTSSAIQAPRWGWGWFSGAVSLILGILIITNWPESSMFIIGLFIGVDLIVTGWAYVMSAFAARALSR